MATTKTLWAQSPNAEKRKLLTSSMLGTNSPFLQPNYGFNDLAEYEEARRNDFASNLKNQLAERRRNLSSALTDQGKSLFDQARPEIFEDLNSRGVYNSSTAVSDATARALKEIELSNQSYLNEYDTAAISAELQAQQDALDSGLDLRRGELESRLQESQAAREEALARDLAKQQSRNSLYSSLISAGGSLGGAYLGAKALGAAGGGGGAGGGLLSNILGGARAGGSPLASGAAGPASPGMFGAGGSLLNTAGTSSIGLGSVGGGLLGYQLGRSAFKPTQSGDRGASNVGAAIGGVGGSFFGPAGSALGSFLGTAVGKAENRLQKGVEKSLGGTAGSIAKYAMPTTAIASVGNKIKKAFCFESNTPIDMEDGSQRPIANLYIGAETKGGEVKSIRTSMVEDGERYIWKGVRITGKHAVKENGKWIRVEDSSHSVRQKGGGIVWSIVTDKHRVWSNGLEMADEVETDNYENLTISQSLEELNKKELVA